MGGLQGGLFPKSETFWWEKPSIHKNAPTHLTSLFPLDQNSERGQAGIQITISKFSLFLLPIISVIRNKGKSPFPFFLTSFRQNSTAGPVSHWINSRENFVVKKLHFESDDLSMAFFFFPP